MRFTWREAKRRINLQDHGFDFVDAKNAFEGNTLTIPDDLDDYGEKRFVTLAFLQGIVVVIAHTESDDLIRIISMRKATKNEKDCYFAQVGDRLETG